jgi:hypothetical protein
MLFLENQMNNMQTDIAVTRRANVGYTKSSNDGSRLFDVLQWFMDHGKMHGGKLVDDCIDLNKGRDFLQEDAEYDIVILHYIFNPPTDRANWEQVAGKNFTAKQRKAFLNSTDHSSERWNRRLKATNAQYIFVFFSYSTEVGYDYIGAIEGYTFSYTLWGGVYQKDLTN